MKFIPGDKFIPLAEDDTPMSAKLGYWAAGILVVIAAVMAVVILFGKHWHM